MTALTALSLVDTRNKIASGELSALAVTEACLQRIAETEPKLHACLHIAAETARQTAAACDETRAKNGAIPADKPLWGVPVSVKDLFCTTDMPTTCASRMLENFTPPYNAFVVERLKDAGAIILAKNNMDEFAMGAGSIYSAFGPAKNPWDITRSPGGSSSGSAAAVAAGQVYGSLGSDSGGSIRQPAALCGCVGMKPTYGRVSRYGAVAFASSFDQVGPLARSVEDCAVLYSVIAGYDARDAMCADMPVQDVFGELSHVDLSGVTCGVPVELWQSDIAPEVAAACKTALERLKAQGASIVEVRLPHTPYHIATYQILSAAEASTNLARFDGVRFGLRKGEESGLAEMYTASRSAGFGEEVKRRILLGTHVLSHAGYEKYYLQAAKIRQLIVNEYDAALAVCDVLVSPTVPATAWQFSAAEDPLKLYKADPLTLGANLTGLPGISLPIGLGADSGLPVGMQVIGKAFEEAMMLRVARALEVALPSIGQPAV